ncbi:maltose O-acetyltransferase [Erysipelotrichaceae bacterium]|nr:maltose O-acetyltransferase [Erysipelotrichaceae bacterium]
MKELEKMVSGALYFVDEEVRKSIDKAKMACYKYNQLPPNAKEEKSEILAHLFAKGGRGASIEAPFHCDHGTNIHVGENFFANYNCVMLDVAQITIGKNVLFGPNVSLYTAGHPLCATERCTTLEFGYPITIGDNCWLGGNVVILPNITIGENSVIAAGSIVTKNIPSNVIAAGNPAKIMRSITREDAMFTSEHYAQTQKK